MTGWDSDQSAQNLFPLILHTRNSVIKITDIHQIDAEKSF